MITHTEWVAQQLKAAEQQLGADDPFVKALRQQLSSLEHQTKVKVGEEDYRENPVTMHVRLTKQAGRPNPPAKSPNRK